MYEVTVYDNWDTYPTIDEYGKYLYKHEFKYLDGAICKFTDYIIGYKAKETKDKFSEAFGHNYTTIDVIFSVDGRIIDSRTFTIQL